MDVESPPNIAVIYLKDNGVSHPNIGVRAIGAYQDSGKTKAVIDIKGRGLRRTWSLLSIPASTGGTNITLMHTILDMGWSVGDRILISPT